jgi:L-asparaginase/Glu-tRNA(Gln) amidotransferase subunit D
MAYAVSKSLFEAGVITGVDMTPEEGLAKLGYVISKDWSQEKKRCMMATSIS